MTILSWVAGIVYGVFLYLWNHFPYFENVDKLLFSYDLMRLIVMAILYAVILHRTLKQVKNISNQRRCFDCENRSRRLNVKVTMNTGLLLFPFYATYLPVIIQYVDLCLVRGCNSVTARQNVAVINWIYSFLFLNSCVNPFVYGLRTKRFKKAFYKNIWSKIFHPTAQ